MLAPGALRGPAKAGPPLLLVTQQALKQPSDEAGYGALYEQLPELHQNRADSRMVFKHLVTYLPVARTEKVSTIGHRVARTTRQA